MPASRPRVFNQPKAKTHRKELRHNTTFPEDRLWYEINKKQIDNCRFRRQFSVGKFILDFYSPELRLAIEVDGETHFTEEAGKYDQDRTDYLKTFNIECVRFTDDEVIQNMEGVRLAIIEKIKEMRRIKMTREDKPLRFP